MRDIPVQRPEPRGNNTIRAMPQSPCTVRKILPWYDPSRELGVGVNQSLQ